MSIVLGGKFRGTGGLGTGVADNGGSVEYARVIDVVLDSSHREWKKEVILNRYMVFFIRVFIGTRMTIL